MSRKIRTQIEELCSIDSLLIPYSEGFINPLDPLSRYGNKKSAYLSFLKQANEYQALKAIIFSEAERTGGHSSCIKELGKIIRRSK